MSALPATCAPLSAQCHLGSCAHVSRGPKLQLTSPSWLSRLMLTVARRAVATYRYIDVCDACGCDPEADQIGECPAHGLVVTKAQVLRVQPTRDRDAEARAWLATQAIPLPAVQL